MKHRYLSRGFSLLEVVAVIAVIGIVTAMAVPMLSKMNQTVESSALENDVKSINNAVQSYLASGGNLDGIESPQVVLDKIKSIQQDNMQTMTVGFTGSMIDKRMAVKIIGGSNNSEATIVGNIEFGGSTTTETKGSKGSKSSNGNGNKYGHYKNGKITDTSITDATVTTQVELPSTAVADSDTPRAVWNSVTKKFEIKTTGEGVEEFYFDEALAEVDYGGEYRDFSTFHYKDGDGWIWDSVDRMPEKLEGPTAVTVGTPVDTAPPGSPDQLSPPVFQPSGGVFDTTERPLQVALVNPNGSSTVIKYRLNGGAEQTYSSPLTLTTDSEIVAYVDGNAQDWVKSNSKAGRWKFQEEDTTINRLEKPYISLSSDEFNNENLTISYSISNPNTHGISDIHYSIVPINTNVPTRHTWAKYSGPGQVKHRDYPDGFFIVAYAKSKDPSRYRDSVNASKIVTVGIISLDLDPPTITLSSDQFNEDTLSISFSISNPNAAGTSEIFYVAIPAGGTNPSKTLWQKYNGSGVLTHSQFPDGFTITAYARSTEPDYYNDSDDVSESTGSFFGVSTDGDILFVLDGSGSMRIRFARRQTRFERMIAETISAINGLSENQRFNVMVFHSGIKWVDGTWQMKPATPANKSQMVSQLMRLSPGGGTNYTTALGAVLAFNPLPTNVIFLSDGQPNNDRYDSELNALIQRNIVVNTVGLSATYGAQTRLERIASQAGGVYRQVDP